MGRVCVRRCLFCGRRFASNQQGYLRVFSRDHAPETCMGRTGVGRRPSTRARAIALAVGRVAKERTTFDNALGSVRIGWIITLSRSTGIATHVFACGLDVAVDPIPVTAPLPNVARHVVQAVPIRWEGAHRRSANKSIFATVLNREYSLPGVRHVFTTRLEVVTPDVSL